MTADPPGPRPPADPPPAAQLRDNRPFLALLGATGVQLTVNSALQFVLLIRVQELTGSTLAGAALIACLAAPPVLTGLVAGVILDRADKRRILIAAVIVRAGLTALLVLADGFSVGAIYAVAFLTAVAGQFAVPAGAASLPSFVPAHALLGANSAFQFAAMSTQLIGLVALSPIMLQAIGYDASYILSAALLAATAPLLARLPALPPEPGRHRAREDLGRVRRELRRSAADIAAAARLVWRDRLAAVALLLLVTGVMLLFMFANLVPRLTVEIIGRRPEDAVFFFWPTGVGALITLFLLPRVGGRFRPVALASAGLAVLAAVVALFGLLGFAKDSLSTWLLFGLVLAGAFPLGLAYGAVNAPAQTLLHERAPAEMRGRLFTAQVMFANAASMAALVVVAGAADAAGVRYALVLLAALIAALTAGSLWLGRPGEARPPPSLA